MVDKASVKTVVKYGYSVVYIYKMLSKNINQNIEIVLCTFVWVSAVFYGLFSTYKFSSDVDPIIISENISPGWSFIDRYKDISDYEWSYWKNHAITLLPWLLIQASVSELLRKYKYIYQQIWYCIISFLFVLYNFGWIALLLMIAQPIIYWSVLICKGTTKSIWICSVICSLMINFIKNLYEMKNYSFLMLTKFNNENFHMVLVAVSWIQLRCISYSLDNIQDEVNNEKLPKVKFKSSILKYEIINVLGYSFYLPLLFLGPIILFKDFMKSFHCNSTLKVRLYNVLLNTFRYIIWLFFIELCLHFIYFNALQFYLEIIEMMPSWCLYGGGLWMGLYFYIKYLITYGIAGTIASFDNVTTENPPRCVLRIHLYSQMWKYFDVGLHKFLIRYIYKPILSQVEFEDPKGNFLLLAVKSFASLICFVFVFLWHGVHYFIFLWSMLNYLGIVLETVGAFLSEINIFKNLLKIFSNKINLERFYALICTPVLMVSALSNFYFFAGAEVGDIFVTRFMNQSFSGFVIMFSCLYCSCRVSQFCANIHAKRIKIN